MDQGQRRLVTNSAMRSHFVVFEPPFFDLFTGIVQIKEPISTQAVEPDRGIEALGVCVVGRLAGTAEVQRDLVRVSPRSPPHRAGIGQPPALHPQRGAPRFLLKLNRWRRRMLIILMSAPRRPAAMDIEPGCCRTPPPSSRRVASTSSSASRVRVTAAIKVKRGGRSTRLLNRGAVAHDGLAGTAPPAAAPRASGVRVTAAIKVQSRRFRGGGCRAFGFS